MGVSAPLERPDAPGGGHGSDTVAASAVFERRVLEDAAEPFGGLVYVHAPIGAPFSFDALARRDDGRDRWGTSGQRTVDLAGDPGVALAEYARRREPGAPADERRIVRLRLRAVTVVDLRRGSVAVALGLPSGARHLADRAVARRVARTVREADVCEGMIVPSMAFLERADRFNVVLFCERLGADLERILCDPEEVGRVRLTT